MKSWKSAGRVERRLFCAVAACVETSPHLIEFLFDPDHPRLNRPADILLKNARCLSSGEYLLVKLVLDLWTEGGYLNVNELFSLEKESLARVLSSLASLAEITSFF
jgi:hypothetical protein